MQYEKIARAAGWKPMKSDIVEIVGFVDVPGVTRFHHHSRQGDITYSTDKMGEDAWRKLCKEEGLIDG